MRIVYENATLFVQTNDENLVGTQVTTIRGCDNLNRLFDLNLYINISDNTAPDFATAVQTEFKLWINESINYKLPQLTANNIDQSVVYVNSMENQNFPSFIYFNNQTYTLAFLPKNDTKYQGNTYYFSIVLKQMHSDYIMNIYYITVKFYGDVYVEPEPEVVDEEKEVVEVVEYTKTQINFTITEFTWKSKGQL